MLRRITQASVQPPTALQLTFDDGASGRIDLAPFIRAGGVFAALSDPAILCRFALAGNGRWIEWPGGADLCADALWRQVRGLNQEAA